MKEDESEAFEAICGAGVKPRKSKVQKDNWDPYYKIVFDDIHDYNPALSILSVKTYANNVYKIWELVDNVYEKAKNPKEVIRVLKLKYKNPNTLKTMLASLIVWMSATRKANKYKNELFDEYNEEITNLKNIIKEKLSTSAKTPKEDINWSNTDDKENLENILLSKVPKRILISKDLAHFRNYIIYMFYTHGVPSRLDLADTKIYLKDDPALDLDDKEFNYLVLNTGDRTMDYYMNVYKTAKSYGGKKIHLEDESLYNAFIAYYKELRNFWDTDTDHMLLLNEDALKPMSRNRLSLVFTKLGAPIGKHLNVSLNRHEVISELVPIDKMKKLADVMGNSISEQVGVYSKS